MQAHSFIEYASVFEQHYVLNLQYKNAKLNVVLDEIAKQSNVKIAYNNEEVAKSKPVSVHLKSNNIKEVLTVILGNEYSFEQLEDYIAISPKMKSSPKSTPAQTGKKQIIKGLIVDAENNPIIGATLKVVKASAGATTDIDGNFQLEIPIGAEIAISYIGYKTKTLLFTGKNANDFRVITLFEDAELLGEVEVVAFATQKKESVVSSISTIRPSELKVPASNLTTALAGKIAGLISYQTSGEPGADNAQFFVRGVTSFGYSASPLILIDGQELTSEDLARLSTDDIESFSILKDATSAALYGSRGANGVIMVTTRKGEEGPAKLSIRLEQSFSTPNSKIELADPYTYMKLHNEAVTTRDPLAAMPYSQEKIDNTLKGKNRNVYPVVDWYNLLFKDVTSNQRVSANVKGGGRVAKYYLSANYEHDTGMLQVDKRNNFNQNIDINRMKVMANIDINMTKTTDFSFRTSANFDDYSGPLDDGTVIYNKVMCTNPVNYPAFYEPDADHIYTKHILFGNNEKGDGLNPYADLVKGYRNYSRAFISVQGQLNQKLDFITKGLNARLVISTNRISYSSSSRQYKPFFYSVGKYDHQKNEYSLTNTNEKTAAEYLDYTKGGEYNNSIFYVEAALNYARTFNKKHDVSGLLVYTMRSTSTSAGDNLQLSLPGRNLGLAGRLTYGYDSRYFIEANFGLNGSERFSKDNRFGFFPSVGFGYLLSNEKFFKNLVSEKVISQLKLKGTYGLVGNDQIGSASDRFFYLSQVNMNAGNAPGFGLDMNMPVYRPTVSIQRYANEKIGWEKSKKMDIGFELTLYNDLKIIADYFQEDRSNILMDRTSIVPEMGLEAAVRANIGKATSKGFDGSLDYNKVFRNGMWLIGRLNFTYAVGKFKEYEEPEYPDAPWKSHKGHSITQRWGYIAERLFIDDADVKASPKQFGEYAPGDIKYKDLNNDGVINEKDQTPIGSPTSPEITYGFGLSAGYKGVDVSCFFHGNARTSFWIDQNRTAPFVNIAKSLGYGQNGNNALLKAYADNHWSETNQNSYALWPRLSAHTIENNNQTSTWFMRNGSFLRLKSVEVGYTFDKTLLRKWHLGNLRLYASGTNLLTFSKFKLWDPEMAGNGLGYPIQKVYNIGLQIGF